MMGSMALLYLVFLAIYVFMIIDVAAPSEAAYTAAGTSKVMWILLVVLLGWIPWLIFAATSRSKVKAAA